MRPGQRPVRPLFLILKSVSAVKIERERERIYIYILAQQLLHVSGRELE